MLPTENLPSYIPATTEVAVSGTSRTECWMCHSPDIRVLYLMCILEYLVTSQIDLTIQAVTRYPVLFSFLHFLFPVEH